MSVVKIKVGEWRNQSVTDKSFKLVKGFQVGRKGGYVTVRNEGAYDVDANVIRIKVASADDIEITDTATEDDVAGTDLETDEQVIERIRNRFNVLDKMAAACIEDKIRALIVTGPPGVGKSHGVEQQLARANFMNAIVNRRKHETVRGAISGVGLYVLLYHNRDAGSVVVFDDCDVWEDQDALNLLKSALDTKKTRRLCWNKASSYLENNDIPNNFEFEGTIIFITNVNFKDGRRTGKIAPHIDALKDRCHYLDLTINTARDRMLRVRQVHRDSQGGLFADHGLDLEQSEEILNFMWEERDCLGDVSMRLAKKIADLYNIDREDWRMLARTLCSA